MVNLRCVGAQRAPRKNPVDHSAFCEKRVGCRPSMLIREGVLKIGATDRFREIYGRHIHIEVAGEHDGRICLVPLCILKSFLYLSPTKAVVTSAFEMKVVGNDRLPADTSIGNKGEPTSEPFLEWFDLRQKPMWLPEVGLLLEPEDTCIRQRPTGQRRLPMVSRRMACALCQFLKLTPKDVIELQLLRYFPRNMKAVRAPGI